jgi:integrase/recombinase XerD
MKALTQDEVRRLLVCITDKRDRLLIQLGLVLGCRVSEIVAIRIRDILPDRIVIHDEKKDALRECVIDTETRSQLDHYLAKVWAPEPHRRHMLFYFSCKTANRILKKWCVTAEIPLDKRHWHALRHTYVVQSLEAGIPVTHVCEQTGDSPVTVLRVYGRPGVDSRRQMINAKGRYWE